MKNFNQKTLAILLSSFFCANLAMAETATGNFQATASLNRTCTVGAATINFGAVTPAETGDATTTGTINFVCTKSTVVQISVNAGNGNGVTYNTRKMSSADSENTTPVSYNLYTNANHTTVWGDGVTSGTEMFDVVGTGEPQEAIIYAKMPLNQYVAADSYSDTLTATLEY